MSNSINKETNEIVLNPNINNMSCLDGILKLKKAEIGKLIKGIDKTIAVSKYRKPELICIYLNLTGNIPQQQCKPPALKELESEQEEASESDEEEYISPKGLYRLKPHEHIKPTNTLERNIDDVISYIMKNDYRKSKEVRDHMPKIEKELKINLEQLEEGQYKEFTKSRLIRDLMDIKAPKEFKKYLYEFAKQPAGLRIKNKDYAKLIDLPKHFKIEPKNKALTLADFSVVHVFKTAVGLYLSEYHKNKKVVGMSKISDANLKKLIETGPIKFDYNKLAVIYIEQLQNKLESDIEVYEDRLKRGEAQPSDKASITKSLKELEAFKNKVKIIPMINRVINMN